VAISLHDHHRRLHDLEVVLSALLEFALRDPNNRPKLSEIVGALASRGEDGAVGLLLQRARSHAR
jgi:hypothetical protein